jgi:dihydroxyacid dehydratase/phosphogluconate dehydratase
MLHLRDLGLLDCAALTVTGQTLGTVLDAWQHSTRRERFRALLRTLDGIDPDDVILPPAAAQSAGLAATAAFPSGNLAPDGAVIKSTSIDPSVLSDDGNFRHEGIARVFTSESAAMAAIRNGTVQTGDVLVLAGCGPMGTGMEETYQLTSALKHLPFGKHVALLTDARFSGVSTGACIGHIGPEALAGGPIGKLRDGDRIRIFIDRHELTGSVDCVGTDDQPMPPAEAAAMLAARSPHPGLAPHPELPEDTRLWAALQSASGGTWGGCVYDADAIIRKLGHAP